MFQMTKFHLQLQVICFANLKTVCFTPKLFLAFKFYYSHVHMNKQLLDREFHLVCNEKTNRPSNKLFTQEMCYMKCDHLRINLLLEPKHFILF